MRRVLLAITVIVMLGAAWAGSAFRAAFEIREALRLGDTATLARRVDWPSVRQSLKRSAGEARSLLAELSQGVTETPARPGLWQRIKAAAAPFLADPLIDRYVTAEGAPQLWKLRQAWRERIRPTIGLAEPQTLLSGTWLADSSLDRGLSIARRIERIAFASPTRMELELRDRLVEHRHWRAVLDLNLQQQSWVLTEVHVFNAKPQQTTTAPLRLTSR